MKAIEVPDAGPRSHVLEPTDQRDEYCSPPTEQQPTCQRESIAIARLCTSIRSDASPKQSRSRSADLKCSATSRPLPVRKQTGAATTDVTAQRSKRDRCLGRGAAGEGIRLLDMPLGKRGKNQGFTRRFTRCLYNWPAIEKGGSVGKTFFDFLCRERNFFDAHAKLEAQVASFCSPRTPALLLSAC